MAALAIRFLGYGVPLVLYPLAGVVALLWVLVRRRGDTVVLTDDAIMIRSRDGDRTYPWLGVLEVSWATGSWPDPSSDPVLRLRGGRGTCRAPTLRRGWASSPSSGGGPDVRPGS